MSETTSQGTCPVCGGPVLYVHDAQGRRKFTCPPCQIEGEWHPMPIEYVVPEDCSARLVTLVTDAHGRYVKAPGGATTGG